MHRPKTSSTALMNACSAVTVAGVGAPPLVRSACSDGTRSLTAALSSAVLQKRLVSGPRIAPRSSCSTGVYTLRVAVSVAGDLGRATDPLGPKSQGVTTRLLDLAPGAGVE